MINPLEGKQLTVRVSNDEGLVLGAEPILLEDTKTFWVAIEDGDEGRAKQALVEELLSDDIKQALKKKFPTLTEEARLQILTDALVFTRHGDGLGLKKLSAEELKPLILELEEPVLSKAPAGKGKEGVVLPPPEPQDIAQTALASENAILKKVGTALAMLPDTLPEPLEDELLRTIEKGVDSAKLELETLSKQLKSATAPTEKAALEAKINQIEGRLKRLLLAFASGDAKEIAAAGASLAPTSLSTPKAFDQAFRELEKNLFGPCKAQLEKHGITQEALEEWKRTGVPPQGYQALVEDCLKSRGANFSYAAAYDLIRYGQYISQMRAAQKLGTPDEAKAMDAALAKDWSAINTMWTQVNDAATAQLVNQANQATQEAQKAQAALAAAEEALREAERPGSRPPSVRSPSEEKRFQEERLQTLRDDVRRRRDELNQARSKERKAREAARQIRQEMSRVAETHVNVLAGGIEKASPQQRKKLSNAKSGEARETAFVGRFEYDDLSDSDRADLELLKRKAPNLIRAGALLEQAMNADPSSAEGTDGHLENPLFLSNALDVLDVQNDAITTSLKLARALAKKAAKEKQFKTWVNQNPKDETGEKNKKLIAMLDAHDPIVVLLNLVCDKNAALKEGSTSSEDQKVVARARRIQNKLSITDSAFLADAFKYVAPLEEANKNPWAPAPAAFTTDKDPDVIVANRVADRMRKKQGIERPAPKGAADFRDLAYVAIDAARTFRTKTLAAMPATLETAEYEYQLLGEELDLLQELDGFGSPKELELNRKRRNTTLAQLQNAVNGAEFHTKALLKDPEVSEADKKRAATRLASMAVKAALANAPSGDPTRTTELLRTALSMAPNAAADLRRLLGSDAVKALLAMKATTGFQTVSEEDAAEIRARDPSKAVLTAKELNTLIKVVESAATLDDSGESSAALEAFLESNGSVRALLRRVGAGYEIAGTSAEFRVKNAVKGKWDAASSVSAFAGLAFKLEGEIVGDDEVQWSEERIKKLNDRITSRLDAFQAKLGKLDKGQQFGVQRVLRSPGSEEERSRALAEILGDKKLASDVIAIMDASPVGQAYRHGVLPDGTPVPAEFAKAGEVIDEALPSVKDVHDANIRASTPEEVSRRDQARSRLANKLPLVAAPGVEREVWLREFQESDAQAYATDPTNSALWQLFDFVAPIALAPAAIAFGGAMAGGAAGGGARVVGFLGRTRLVSALGRTRAGAGLRWVGSGVSKVAAGAVRVPGAAGRLTERTASALAAHGKGGRLLAFLVRTGNSWATDKAIEWGVQEANARVAKRFGQDSWAAAFTRTATTVAVSAMSIPRTGKGPGLIGTTQTLKYTRAVLWNGLLSTAPAGARAFAQSQLKLSDAEAKNLHERLEWGADMLDAVVEAAGAGKGARALNKLHNTFVKAATAKGAQFSPGFAAKSYKLTEALRAKAENGEPVDFAAFRKDMLDAAGADPVARNEVDAFVGAQIHEAVGNGGVYSAAKLDAKTIRIQLERQANALVQAGLVKTKLEGLLFAQQSAQYELTSALEQSKGDEAAFERLAHNQESLNEAMQEATGAKENLAELGRAGQDAAQLMDVIGVEDEATFKAVREKLVELGHPPTAEGMAKYLDALGSLGLDKDALSAARRFESVRLAREVALAEGLTGKALIDRFGALLTEHGTLSADDVATQVRELRKEVAYAEQAEALKTQTPKERRQTLFQQALDLGATKSEAADLANEAILTEALSHPERSLHGESLEAYAERALRESGASDAEAKAFVAAQAKAFAFPEAPVAAPVAKKPAPPPDVKPPAPPVDAKKPAPPPDAKPNRSPPPNAPKPPPVGGSAPGSTPLDPYVLRLPEILATPDPAGYGFGAQDAAVRAALNATFGRDISRTALESIFAAPGCTAEIVHVEVGVANKVSFKVVVRDASGAVIATIERSVRKNRKTGALMWINDKIDVAPGKQRGGTAKVFYARTTEFLRAVTNGDPKTEIHLKASDVGCYSWAKDGFEFAIEPEKYREQMHAGFERWLKLQQAEHPEIFTDAVAADLRARVASFTQPQQFAELSIPDPRSPAKPLVFTTRRVTQDPTSNLGKQILEDVHVGKAFLLDERTVWEGIKRPFAASTLPKPPAVAGGVVERIATVVNQALGRSATGGEPVVIYEQGKEVHGYTLLSIDEHKSPPEALLRGPNGERRFVPMTQVTFEHDGFTLDAHPTLIREQYQEQLSAMSESERAAWDVLLAAANKKSHEHAALLVRMLAYGEPMPIIVSMHKWSLKRDQRQLGKELTPSLTQYLNDSCAATAYQAYVVRRDAVLAKLMKTDPEIAALMQHDKLRARQGGSSVRTWGIGAQPLDANDAIPAMPGLLPEAKIALDAHPNADERKALELSHTFYSMERLEPGDLGSRLGEIVEASKKKSPPQPIVLVSKDASGLTHIDKLVDIVQLPDGGAELVLEDVGGKKRRVPASDWQQKGYGIELQGRSLIALGVPDGELLAARRGGMALHVDPGFQRTMLRSTGSNYAYEDLPSTVDEKAVLERIQDLVSQDHPVFARVVWDTATPTAAQAAHWLTIMKVREKPGHKGVIEFQVYDPTLDGPRWLPMAMLTPAQSRYSDGVTPAVGRLAGICVPDQPRRPKLAELKTQIAALRAREEKIAQATQANGDHALSRAAQERMQLWDLVAAQPDSATAFYALRLLQQHDVKLSEMKAILDAPDLVTRRQRVKTALDAHNAISRLPATVAPHIPPKLVDALVENAGYVDTLYYFDAALRELAGTHPFYQPLRDAIKNAKTNQALFKAFAELCATIERASQDNQIKLDPVSQPPAIAPPAKGGSAAMVPQAVLDAKALNDNTPIPISPENAAAARSLFKRLQLVRPSDVAGIVEVFAEPRGPKADLIAARFTRRLPEMLQGVQAKGPAQGEAVLAFLKHVPLAMREAEAKETPLDPAEIAGLVQALAVLPDASAYPLASALSFARPSPALLALFAHYRAALANPGTAEDAARALAAVATASENGTLETRRFTLELARALMKHDKPPSREALSALLADVVEAHGNAAHKARFSAHGLDGFLPTPAARETTVKSIRNGPHGRIRGADELDSRSAVHAANANLAQITPLQVGEILAAFGEKQGDRARLVFARAAAFGNMESLVAYIRRLREAYPNGKIYRPLIGSLGDNLTYLGVNKWDGGKLEMEGVRATQVLDKDAIVVLDDAMLSKMERDPAFTDKLIQSGAKLVHPRGFDSGLNLFSSTTPLRIKERVSLLLERASAIQAQSGMSFDQSVNRALDEQTLARLAKLDKRLLGMLETVTPTMPPDTSNEGLAWQINGESGLTPEVLENALMDVPEQYHAYLRELVARQTEAYSPRRLAHALQSQHARLEAMAAERGIPKENIFFYVPNIPGEGNKSYGMMAMAHRAATDTPANKYVTAVELATLPKNSLVVVLDDVAGTGISLQGVYSTLKKRCPGHVVIAPVISSEQSTALFKGGDFNGTYLPHQQASTLRNSPFFQSLGEADRELLTAAAGSFGFGQNGLSIAFPYMVPDNDNAFFGDRLAHQFIVERAKQASKGYAFVPPQYASFWDWEDHVKAEAVAAQATIDSWGKPPTPPNTEAWQTFRSFTPEERQELIKTYCLGGMSQSEAQNKINLQIVTQAASHPESARPGESLQAFAERLLRESGVPEAEAKAFVAGQMESALTLTHKEKALIAQQGLLEYWKQLQNTLAHFSAENEATLTDKEKAVMKNFQQTAESIFKNFQSVLSACAAKDASQLTAEEKALLDNWKGALNAILVTLPGL